MYWAISFSNLGDLFKALSGNLVVNNDILIQQSQIVIIERLHVKIAYACILRSPLLLNLFFT